MNDKILRSKYLSITAQNWPDLHLVFWSTGLLEPCEDPKCSVPAFLSCQVWSQPPKVQAVGRSGARTPRVEF